MKLVVGLGNPGNKYVNTRHNVGFKFVEQLAGDSEWRQNKSANAFYNWVDLGKKAILLAPQTFMNKSGQAVKQTLKKHPKLTNLDIFVVHDDLDISLGKYKIQKGKGPKEHKGVKSVEDSLGFNDFWRIRIGVENRKAGNAEIPGEEYVLKPFLPEEKSIIDDIINQSIKELVEQINSS